MKIKNKELIQSYVLTTAKYNFTVDEKRILYKIVESLQDLTKGITLSSKYIVQTELYGDRILNFEIADFLPVEDSRNHGRIIKALTNLNDKSFDYTADNGWERIRIIESPKMKGIGKKMTSVQFRLDKRMYEAFLDFSKGFKKFELELSMKFETTSAMRFYELFANQKTPITYSIPYLKEMFGLSDKYNNKDGISNFIKKVIEPAKRELDKHSPNSFNYKYKDRELKKDGKIHNILFIPYEIPKNRNVELEEHKLRKIESPVWDLGKEFVAMLKRDFDISDVGIKNNMKTFIAAQKLPHFRDVYSRAKGRSASVDNRIGYLIKTLKTEIENQ